MANDLSLTEKEEIVIDAYRRRTRINISRYYRSKDLLVVQVGDDYCIWKEDKWHVGHRWHVQERDVGAWRVGFEAVNADDGGGSFDSIESALRTALSLEFDARLRDAWSEIGEYESEDA